MVTPTRVNKREPCKICGHDSWCFHFENEVHVCMRREDEVVDGKWYKQSSKRNKDGAMQTAYRDQPRPKKGKRKAQTRYWLYHDLVTGQPLAKVVRKDLGNGKKEFYQRHLNPKTNRWNKGLPSDIKAKLGLYKSQELKQAVANGETIFVAEGETTADAIAGLGLFCTTNIGGSGSFHKEQWEVLKDASVVLCPDGDGESIKFFRQIAEVLPNAQWLYVYPESFIWNNLFKGGGGVDALDWITEKKPTIEEFVQLIVPNEREVRIIDLNFPDEKTKKTDAAEYLADEVIDTISQLVDKDLDAAEVSAELKDIRSMYGLQASEAKEIYQQLYWKKETADSLKSNRERNKSTLENSDVDIDLQYVFGARLGSELGEMANGLRIDPNRVATPLLTAAGKCVGGRIPLCIKRDKGEATWKQYPIFFGVDVGAPGWGKSTLMGEIFAPIRKRQKEENQRYKEALEKLAAVKDRWGLMSKDEQKSKVDTDENPRVYAKEHCNFVFDLLQETTTEGLFRRMSEQAPGHGLLLESDEISGLFRSFNQYSKNGGNALQLFLGLWNEPSYTGFNRANLTDSYHASGQTLSLYGGIQPDLFNDAFEVDQDSNGLVSRFLFTVARLPENFNKWSDAESGIRSTLDWLYQTLSKLPQFECDFSPEAKKLFIARWEYHRKLIGQLEGVNPGLMSYYGKADSIIARIALVLHLIDCCYNEGGSTWETVELPTLERAIYLYDFYVSQFKLLQTLNSKNSENSLDRMLAIALGRLRRDGRLEVASFSRIYNRRNNRYKNERINRTTTRKIFAELATMGFGILDGDVLTLNGKGGSPPPAPPKPPIPPTLNGNGNTPSVIQSTTKPKNSSNGRSPQATTNKITNINPAPIVGNLAMKPQPEPQKIISLAPMEPTKLVSEYTSEDEPTETVIFNEEPRQPIVNKPVSRREDPKPPAPPKSTKKYAKTPTEIALESPKVSEENSPWKDSYHGTSGLFSIQRGEDIYDVEWNPDAEEFATELIVKKAYSAAKTTITIQEGDRFYYPHRNFSGQVNES